MESRIEEVREEIEHLAHARPTRRRVVVTVGVLAVTALTTTAAALAALASSNEGAAIRNRQEAAANAATADLKYEQNISFANDRIDAGNEAKYRAQILRCFGNPSCQLFYLGSNGPGAQTLNQQATGAEAVQSDISKSAPTSEANVGDYDAKQFIPVDVQQQTAYAYGQAATGWLGREDGYLATIGALAVALFLFGLALTIPHRATGNGFIALAIVLTLFSAVRVGLVSLGSVPGPSATAVNDFAQADYQTSASGGTDQNAQKLLEKAVGLRPDFANAWSMLGSVHEDEAAGASDSRSARAQYAAAVDDFQHAIDRGRQASIDYNNLAFAQMLDGQTAAAATSVRQALALDPSDDVAMATLAEDDLMAGHLDTALSDLDRALSQVARYGPEFRQLWFDYLRPDENTLTNDGVPASSVDAFFTKAKDAQAGLQDNLGASPGQLHGASVTSFDVTQQSKPVSGYVEALAQLSGLQTGDVVRMDFFQNGIEYLSAPSKSWKVGSDSQPTLSDQSLDWAPPVPTGDATAEIYVNGNLIKTQTFTMK